MDGKRAELMNVVVKQNTVEKNMGYTFFFHLSSPFSNFHPSKINYKEIDFISNEQFMMFSKAKTFGDEVTSKKILVLNNQGIAKRFLSGEITSEDIVANESLSKGWSALMVKIKGLGREVKGYEEEVWSRKREKVVLFGARLKFTQNESLKNKLLATGESLMIEASPYDKIWGAGLSESDPLILDKKNWKGENLLGKVLMSVRDYIKLEDVKLNSLILKEHASSSYAPRTWHNAKSADVTIGIAIDYGTQGEILTKKAAGNKYLKLDWLDSPEKNAKILLDVMEKNNLGSVNVAGNGVYSFVKRDIGQEQVNKYVYELLSAVHSSRPIKKIFTGGQTGVDIAGAVAGFSLGIETEVTFPKGYKQRNAKGYDHDYTQQEIFESIKGQSDNLFKMLNEGVASPKLKP